MKLMPLRKLRLRSFPLRGFSAPWLLPVLFAVSLGCGSLQHARADTPDEQYQFANGLYSQKLWSLAAEKLRAFVTEFPNHPRARNAAYQLGGALYRATNNTGQTDYAAVAAAYERAIAKYPDPKLTPPARFELGDAYFNLGQYDKAIAAHSAFLASNPPADTAAQAQYWIGESYYALKKPAEAKTAYEAVLTKHPTLPIAAYAHYSLGLLALDAAQYSAAANAFRAVLAKYPNAEVAPESRLHLGAALLGAKQWTAARDAFRAVQQDAGAAAWKSDAALGLADAEFGAKNWTSAATAYEQALAALKSEDARRNAAQFRLGDSFYNDKKYEQALKAYAPLLASKDSKVLPNALYWNGNALRALNRHNEAAASYRRLLSEYSNHALAPRAALRLGDALSDAKDTGAAAEAYRTVLTKYAKSDAAREAQQALVALAGEVAGAPTNGTSASSGGTSLEQVLRALPPGPATSNAQLQLAQAAFAGGNWARDATCPIGAGRQTQSGHSRKRPLSTCFHETARRRRSGCGRGLSPAANAVPQGNAGTARPARSCMGFARRQEMERSRNCRACSAECAGTKCCCGARAGASCAG